MLRKNYLSLALAGALVAACGGDDSSSPTEGDGAVKTTNPDAGHDGGIDGSADASTTGGDAAAGDAGRLQVQSGTYNVSNVQKVSDECMYGFEDPGALTTLQLGNTGTDFWLGTRYTSTTDPKYVPDSYSLGEGGFSSATSATLTMSAMVSSSGCSYTVMRTSVVTFPENNTANVDLTSTESGHTGCDIKTDCTSHYTMTLTKASN